MVQNTMKKPFTIEDVAEWIGLDRMTLYSRLKAGTIPAHRIGHQWRFDQDELQEWFRHQPPGDVMEHLENLLLCVSRGELEDGGAAVDVDEDAIDAARAFFVEVKGREPGEPAGE